jgi:hypothetical protein
MALPQPIPDDFGLPQTPPEFLQLALNTLGNAGDDEDGFHQIFDPVANSYPGDTIGSDLLNPHLDEIENAAGDLGGEHDPAFNDDAAAAQSWADQNREWLTQFLTFDPNPPPIILPDPNSDLPPDDGSVLIYLQDGQPIKELPGNWIQVADDGTVTWQAGEAAPQPIELFLSVDHSDFLLFHAERSGSDKPGWFVQGHHYYFELRSQDRPIAIATLDTNSDTAIPNEPNSGEIETEVVIQLLNGDVVHSHFHTPPAKIVPPPSPPPPPPPPGPPAPPPPPPQPPPFPPNIMAEIAAIRAQLNQLENQYQGIRAAQLAIQASIPPGGFMTPDQVLQFGSLDGQAHAITLQVQQLNNQLMILENTKY